MLKILLTADVECWPSDYRYDAQSIRQAFDKYYLGQTPSGLYGMPYILDKLSQYNLKSTFFIDTLLARRAGQTLLHDMVQPVLDAKQEAQLHIHVEFLDDQGATSVKRLGRANLSQLSRQEQLTVLGEAVADLKQTGVNDVIAFRAGNFGANSQTLEALGQLGVRYDSSYDHAYHSQHHSFREAAWARCPSAPYQHGDVVEFPVSYFEQWSGQLRRLQLTACSFAELRSFLELAWKKHYQYCVLVYHSFELLHPASRAFPDPFVLYRFEQLCKYLDTHRDRFETCHFHDLAQPHLARTLHEHPPLIQLTPQLVLGRMGEQLLRRLPGQLMSPMMNIVNALTGSKKTR